jgi:aspartyl/asparaginyl-tRNA synthetase
MKYEFEQIEIALNELRNSNDVTDAAYSTLKFVVSQVKNTQSEKIKEFANWLQSVMWDEPDKDFEQLADDFLKLP